MKKLFEEHFERTWMIIFLVCFFYTMLPLPYLYNETYVPSWGGVPSYVYGWIGNTIFVFALIVVYYKMCMKRKEYHVYDEENQKEDDK